MIKHFKLHILSLTLFTTPLIAEESTNRFSLGVSGGGEYSQNFYTAEMRFGTVGIYYGFLPDSIANLDHQTSTSDSNVTIKQKRGYYSEPIAIGLIKYTTLEKGEIALGAAVHLYETCDIAISNSSGESYCNNRSKDQDLDFLIGYKMAIGGSVVVGVNYSIISGIGLNISLF